MGQPHSLTPIKKLAQLWRQMVTRLVGMEAATVETDPLQAPKTLSDKLVLIFVGIFLVGLLMFLTKADFSKEGWSEAYFVWDKGKDLLALFILFILKRKYRPILLLIIIPASIRFIWDMIAYFLQVDVNIKGFTTIQWLTVTGIIIFLSIKDLLSQWKHHD